MHVIYSDLMVAPAQGSSPSAAKPRPVVEAWMALDPSVRIVPPVPVTIDDFARAHERRFVEHVFAQQKSRMGLVVRTIGIARATTKIGMANLVYNLKRVLFLRQHALA